MMDSPEIVQKDDTPKIEISPNTPLLDSIIHDYGYGKITLIAVSCLFLSLLTEGIEFSLFSVYLIPLTSFYSFTSFQVQLISSSMFISIGLGSMSSGYISQKFHRITPIKILYFFVIMFHFCMALINNIFIFALCRNLIGFLIGIIIPIQFNLTAEYLPIKYRSFTMSSVWIGWNAGQMINAFLMMAFMPNLEKEKVVICLLSMEIFCIFAFTMNLLFLRDSPRNLLMNVKTNEATTTAYDILNQMRKENGKSILTDEDKCLINSQLLMSGDGTKMDGHISEMFNNKYKLTSCLLILSWFLNAMITYGLLLVYSLTLQKIHRNHPQMNSEIVASSTLTSIAVLPSNLFAGIFSEIEFLGRKKAMILGNLCPLLTIFLSIKFTSLISFWFALSYIFISISYTIVNTYTAEVYPTMIRDKALGVMFTAARIGGFLSQIIFIELINLHLFLPYYFSMVVSLICICLIYCLPYETYGLPLDKCGDENNLIQESENKNELFCQEEGKKLITYINTDYCTFK